MSDTQAYRTDLDPSDTTSDINTWKYIIRTALSQVRTITPVKVISCTNSGGLAPAGTVDVQPIVNQIDGYGTGYEHGIIHARPYLRWQGGTSAIILDPAKDDVGLLAVCDRDTSLALQNLTPSNPGSWRKFDFADGIYIPAIGGGVPIQFIQFANGGIVISPDSGTTQVNLQPGLITLTSTLIRSKPS